MSIPLRRAAACLWACAAPAFAQTAPTVQVLGTLDIGVGRFKGAPAGVNALDRGVAQVAGGLLTTSWIGVRGHEDLGGGLAASFELASFLRMDTGASGRNDAIGPPVNVAADPFWSRQAWVGIGSPAWGRVRLGNNSTLFFLNAITSNAFGDSTAFSPLVLLTFIGSPLSGGTGWTNQLMVDSPRIGGFSVSAALSLSENQGGRNAGLRASYADGPLAFSFAAQSVKKNPLTFADGTSANNTRAWMIGGGYDLGAVKLQAHLGAIDNRGTEAAPLDVRYRVWDLSATVPVGAGRVLAAYGQRKTGDAVGPVPATVAGGNVERRILSVGYDHDLSRRTDVYAVAMLDHTRTRSLPVPPRAVSAHGSSVAVGIRHRF